MSLTATYESGTGRVRIQASGITAPTTAIERSIDGTSWTTVRGAAAAPVSSGNVLTPDVYDYEYPVGVPVTYRARFSPIPALVGTGTQSNADNGSVTPPIPAGTTAGDLMVMWAAVRGAATMATPAGWLLILQAGRAMWFKGVVGGETAPTITVSGGAAGDTVSARIATFRGTNGPDNQANGDNASAQNVAFGSISPPDGARSLVVAGVVKADDWGSITPPTDWLTAWGNSGSTAIGNDQGIALFYRVATGVGSISGGTATVTGGAAATSRWSTVSFARQAEQLMTGSAVTVAIDRVRLFPAGYGAGLVVTVSGWGDVEYGDRSSLIPILGAELPVVVAEIRTAGRWQLRLRTDDATAAETLRTALRTGVAVYLQGPAACPFPLGWHHVGSIDVGRTSARGVRRYITAMLTACAPPAVP